MTGPSAPALSPAEYRRRIALALTRCFAITVVLVALYYLLPLSHVNALPIPVYLLIGLVVLLAVAAWQIRAIIAARFPAVRAVEALAGTVPLFLLLFAAAYYLMARTDPASFNHQLTRTDAIYFTVTVFSTVGFGDITAVSEPARIVVTVQMILDLLILGLGIRVFFGAVQRGRQHSQSTDTGDSP